MDDTLILVFDEALLDSMREIVDQRRQMTDMLEKAEQYKQDVNDHVYQNVVTDYKQRLSKIDTQYQPLQQQMHTELQRIRGEQQQVEADLEVHRQQLEETRFRAQVGEYSEQELHLKEQTIEAELQRLEGLVATANLTQTTARELLGNDIEAIQPPQENTTKAPAINAADSLAAQDATHAEQDDVQSALDSAPVNPDTPQDLDQRQTSRVGQAQAERRDYLAEELLGDIPEPTDLDPPVQQPAKPSSDMADTSEIPNARTALQEEPEQERNVLGGPFGLSENSSLADAFATPPAEGSDAPVFNRTETQPEITPAETDDDATELIAGGFDADSTKLAPSNEQLFQTLLRGFLRQMKPHDGRYWEITSQGLILGRNPHCDVVIQEPKVSRHHAVIAMETDLYYIEDTSSGGGVRINGEAVSRQRLNSGDEIAVGEHIFVFDTEYH